MHASVSALDEARLLSPLNPAAIQLMSLDPESKTMLTDRPGVAGFMRDYKFRVASWPIFISRRLVEERFEEVAACIPGIFQRAMRAMFGNDSAAFHRYTGWPEKLYDILQHYMPEPSEFICRYDAVVRGTDVKLVELNCSSAVGGWQGDWLEPTARIPLDRHETTRGWRFSHRSIFRSIAAHVMRNMLKRSPGVEGDVLLYDFMAGEVYAESLAQSLGGVWKDVRTDEFGESSLRMFNDFRTLDFNDRCEVFHEGRRVGAVLCTFAVRVEVPDEIFDKLTEAALRGTVFFPDSGLHTILSNKKLFALASDAAEQRRLSHADAEMVARYLPWSALAIDGSRWWRGALWSMRELLLARRESFVIKKADSYAGRDVYVGRFTDAPTWATAIEDAFADGGWIVQEYCVPGRTVAFGPDESACDHDVVWGLFALGGHYGGAFVRAQPSRGSSGVINSAGGAIEFVVMEDLHTTPAP